MTVAAIMPAVDYQEDGATLAFPVPFRFLATEHLEVRRIAASGVVAELRPGIDYSTSGGETDAGGTLTLASTVAGARLAIRRMTARRQQIDYETNDNFPAQSHEDGLDRAMLIDQEQDVRLDDLGHRALLLPEGETGAELPLAAERAGRFFAWDAAGRPVTSAGTGADAGLRGDLLAVHGGALVGFRQAGAATAMRTLGDKAAERFHAMDLLGDAVDPAADHGALLTAAIAARWGTLADGPNYQPALIDFGDARYTYNLLTPIRVSQNHIHLVGDGARLVMHGQEAIIVDYGESLQINFGAVVRGLNVYGHCAGDAISVRSASQCKVENVRNFATVGRAVLHFSNVYSSQTHNIKSDGTTGTCENLLREDVLEKVPGMFFNSIANRHTDLLGYACTGSGAVFLGSDGFHVQGDFETCQRAGVEVISGRFGTVSSYFERNGLLLGSYPADVVIRSEPGGGSVGLHRAQCIAVTGCEAGGEPVNGFWPMNVHIYSADDCTVVGNQFAGSIRVEEGCERTKLLHQHRWIGQVFDEGEYTEDWLSLGGGAVQWKAGPFNRLFINPTAAGGAVIGSPGSLLAMTGLRSIGSGQTPGHNFWGQVEFSGSTTTRTVTFSTPEPDNSFIPFLVVRRTAGNPSDPVEPPVWHSSSATGFSIDFDPQGATFIIYWLLIRI